MGLLWDINTNVNAQRDERQDNRSLSQSYSTVIAPIFAGENSKVYGNSADATSKASTDAKNSKEDGFTGGNAQNTLIAGGIVLGAAGLIYVLLKK